jgi:preprotein translocase subunit SecE
MNPVEKVKDWSGRTSQFYSDVRGEVKKVSWPSRDEVISTTVVVIAAVFFFGLYLGLVDYVLSSAIMNGILNYFSGTGG